MIQDSRTPIVPVWLALASLVSACGGGGGGGGGTPPPTTAIAKTAANSGDAQGGTVGQPLSNPLRVLVTDGGTPSAGVTVSWSTTAAGGSLDPTSGPTDADGIATATWNLGNASGSQTAQAALTGAAGSPVGFSATAAPGSATTLAKGSGDNQTAQVNAALATPVQAKAVDQFGNGVPGVDVNWSAVGGNVSAGTVATNSSGISPVTVTLGPTAGEVTITATSGSLSGSPLAFKATATNPPPPGTTISVINNAFNPSSLTVPRGTTVTWSWASAALQHNVVPDATEPVTSGGLVNGPHTYQYRFDNPGTFRYYCANHGGPNGFGMSGTITVQ